MSYIIAIAYTHNSNEAPDEYLYECNAEESFDRLLEELYFFGYDNDYESIDVHESIGMGQIGKKLVTLYM